MSKTAIPAYVLSSNGTDSMVHRSENALAGMPVWTAGASFAGAYTLMKPISTPGSIMVYCPIEPASGTATLTPYAGTWSTLTPAFGDTFTVTSTYSSSFGGFHSFGANFDDCYVTEWISGAVTARVQDAIDMNMGGACSNTFYQAAGANDGNPFTDFAGVAAINTHIGETHSQSVLSSQHGDATVFTFRILGIAGTVDANVRLSTDYGATFGSPVAVGPGYGAIAGFDTQYIGSINYAACDGKVRKASTPGGSYSDHTSYGTSPASICIPWSRFGSSTTNNLAVSDPDYLVAELDGTLWKVDGATASKTNITPSGVTGCNSANALRMWQGVQIDYLAQVSGVTHLFHSDNSGTSFSDRGAVDATFIRGRRKERPGSDPLAKNQLWLTGGSVLDFSASKGAVLSTRTKPSTNGGGLDVLG